jgi:phenylacetic acid degradation operon negative regulatory protein
MFSAMPAPSPRSLVLDLLSTLRGESMPVGGLVAAGAVFGIPENGMRVAIARLLAAGALARDERGRYRLGPAAAPLNERVAAWRTREERVARWGGGWIGVHGAALPRGRGKPAAACARALRLLGFRELSRGLWLRPDNLRGGVAAVREELLALGLAAGTPVFALSGLDPENEARARALWDVRALRARYRGSRRELAASEARLAPGKLRESAALRESFALGGRVIRELVADPLLPEALVPAAERRALLAALLRYDRAGRRAWADFMARHGAPHAALPAQGLAAAGWA